MTTDERYAVLSALIDREPVDPDQLAAALDDRAGRQVLVDFVCLRAKVAREHDADEEGPRGHVAPASRMRATRFLQLAAAILLPLALGLGGGYWWRLREQGRPPTPTRVLQFVPGVDWK
jgi:hypothetical protein